MARHPKGAGGSVQPPPATDDAGRINPATPGPERGARAYAWRRSKGLSRADLAELIGFSESIIRDMEAGKRRGKKPEHSAIDEASWRRFGLACAAIDGGLEPMF